MDVFRMGKSTYEAISKMHSNKQYILLCMACNGESKYILGGEVKMGEEKINRNVPTLDQVKNIAETIREVYKKPVIKMGIVEGEPSLLESKIGGTPYIPHEGQMPRDSQGVQMKLVAQIDCASIRGLEDFPKKGLLQFFVATDEMIGLDFKDLASGKGSKVIYYETFDQTVTEEEVLGKIEPLGADRCFPIGGSYPIVFFVREEEMGLCDYRYDELFIREYNAQFKENSISSIYDLDDAIVDEICASQDEFGHKIGGYPGFTQTDPRMYDTALQAYDTLLLQIDSESDYKKYDIMWGDTGICNFFIRFSDLKNLDFSKVLYYWDCY